MMKNHKRKVKKAAALFGGICIAAAFAVSAVIALNAYYYKDDRFPAGIWINGIYCTGMTPQEVSALVTPAYYEDFDTVSVHTLRGDCYELPLEEYGVTIEYLPVLERLLRDNQGYRWLLNIAEPRHYSIEPEYRYDMLAMKAKLEEQTWLNENLYNPQNTVSIIKSAEAGYILVDETRDLLLRDNAVKLISEGIVNQLTDIDLAAPGNRELCYQSVPYTDKMKDTLEKWEGVRNFQDFQMIYEFGDRTEIVDENVVADWIALDDNGHILYDENNQPVLDKTLVEEYVAYLCTTYNTVGAERSFRATRGDIVKVSGGGYGNELDAKAEYDFLLDAFERKESGVRTPVYLSEAKQKGLDDIGDTYIEVDMGSQHMYYYVDGKVVIETPVVTGNTSRRWGTPSKVCYVYFKQRNRVLRGQDYATPVKYWMAVDGHIGIHDATWRKEFGGEIYKTNGSHGCINTPLETMAKLYELVEEGTPVIMFY